MITVTYKEIKSVMVVSLYDKDNYINIYRLYPHGEAL